jgi:hypothetical protein
MSRPLANTDLVLNNVIFDLMNINGPGETFEFKLSNLELNNFRTRGPRLARAMLYQAELQAQCMKVKSKLTKIKKGGDPAAGSPTATL